MADDDEPMIVNVTRNSSRRRLQNKKRKRKSRLDKKLHSEDCLPGTSGDIPTAQPDIWIINEPQPADSDHTDLIVIDSVESDEGDSNSKDAKEDRDCDEILLDPETRIQNLLEKIHDLESENHRLRYSEPKAEGVVYVDGPPGGAPVQVVFFSEHLAKKYRTKAEEFLKDISSNEQSSFNGTQSSDCEKVEAESKFVVDKYSQDDKLHARKCDWTVPVYNNDFGEVMRISASTEETPLQPKANVEHCFNCMGEHLIKDCPEKHNAQRISQNKRRVYGNRGPQNKSRLGNEKLWQLKYKPGRISESLRKALHLKPIQIPPYIYTMRVLGYPPGWLKEAEIDNSEINIYDSDGKAVASSRNTREDGELECAQIKDQYDQRKFIDYPGFNVPVPSHCIDEHLKLGLPPMQLHQQRVEVEKHMTQPPESRPYRKRRLELLPDAKKKTIVVQRVEQDMEVEDIPDVKIQSSDEGIEDEFGSPSPKAVIIDDDSTDQSQDLAGSSQESSRVSSPTLTDLEERKLKLINDLKVASAVDDEGESENPVSGSLDEVEMTMGSTPTRSDDKISDLCFSKSVEPGTPVLLKHSPFSKLPEPRVFASGISDHINYENLPNATGCFDKLRNVLSVVRRTREVSLD